MWKDKTTEDKREKTTTNGNNNMYDSVDTE